MAILYYSFVTTSEGCLPATTHFLTRDFKYNPGYCKELVCVPEASVVRAAQGLPSGRTTFAALAGGIKALEVPSATTTPTHNNISRANFLVLAIHGSWVVLWFHGA
jgi:hypothetical protein